MHVYSRRVDVGGSRTSLRPLHRVVRGIGVANNWRRVGSGRGWCRLCHGGRVTKRWSCSNTRLLVVTLEIRVKAAVFACIINRFDRRVGDRGLGRGSRKVRRRGRLHYSIWIIHSSRWGWIRLHVPIRWIPVVVVHGVGVMWIAPRSSRIVRMVGVGNEGRLLPRRGWLRSCSDRSRGFQRSSFVLVNRGVRLWWIDGSTAAGITVQNIPQIGRSEGVVVVTPRQMSLNATLPCVSTRWIQITDLDPNPTSIVDAIVLCVDGFPRGLRVVESDKRKR